MKKVAFVVCLIMLAANMALASDNNAEENKNASGLSVPRFASIRNTEANMRTGPGTRYPIDWVYKRQGIPVEITAEYDIWRRVRDPDGAEGWIHKNELSGKRTAIVTNGGHELRDDDSDTSPVVAHLEQGALGRVVACGKDWCKVKFEDVKGYLHKSDFWGAYPNEIFD